MQSWLDRYDGLYGDRIRKNRSSTTRIMAMAQLSEEHARALQAYCHSRPVPDPLLPDPEFQDEEPVVKNLSPDDLLLRDDYTYNPVTRTYLTYIPGLPKPMITSEETHKAIIRAYSNFNGSPASINEISRTFGMPREWVVKYLRIHGMTHDREPFSKEEILSRPDEELVDDALQQRRAVVHRKIEQAKWADVQRNAMKWMHFEDTVLKVFQEALADSRITLKVPKVSCQSNHNPFALVVTPADLHYGKVGVDGYSRQVAKDLLFRTTQELLTWVTLYGSPEVIIVSGMGDWFHIDNDDATTTAGTKQDVDVSFSQLLVEGCELMASYIQILRQVAPVQIVNIPGYHDTHATTVMGLFLSALYRKDKDVQVISGKPRHYVVYGEALMGFTHGKDDKLVSLGPIMATENKQDWGETQHRIWFLGHHHHETVVDMHGVQVISIPTLTGTDQWHNQMGYVGSRRALAGFIIDKDKGLVNSLNVPV